MAGQDNQHSSRPAAVLVIDKPAGRSSMSIVAEVRRKTGRTKTGHAGTLDPLATGILVLGVGKATKAIDRLMAGSKRYDTAIDLSATTASYDLESEVEPVEIAEIPDEERIREAVGGFSGLIDQRPPAFSAKFVEGQRSYMLARRGKAVELPSRPVLVHDISVLEYEWPVVRVAIHCAKGFYVRSLARDLGAALGTGGYCMSIRRTAVGPFDLSRAVKPDDLPERIGQGDLILLEEALRMMDEMGETSQAGETDPPAHL
jgi:tRNA pseudouridine55 synthase